MELTKLKFSVPAARVARHPCTNLSQVLWLALPSSSPIQIKIELRTALCREQSDTPRLGELEGRSECRAFFAIGSSEVLRPFSPKHYVVHRRNSDLQCVMSGGSGHGWFDLLGCTRLPYLWYNACRQREILCLTIAVRDETWCLTRWKLFSECPIRLIWPIQQLASLENVHRSRTKNTVVFEGFYFFIVVIDLHHSR